LFAACFASPTGFVYMSTNLKRAVVLLAWAAAALGWFLYQRSTGLGTAEALQSFIDTTRGAWWALAAFVAVYAVRPLVLFPATLMTLAGGLLFGPVIGILATVLGANASAMVAYWIARSVGFERATDPDTAGLLARWSTRMRNDSFVTVMIMRLVFLPYAGFLRINPGSFLLATALGSLPGTIAFTLAGASIQSLDEGPSGIDPVVLIASVVVFLVSVGISIVIKRRPTQALVAA